MRLNLRLYRTHPQPHYETFDVEVSADANVLDAIERVWADQDRSLMFRHTCHHASCGSCGLRVNDVEKLPCVTPVTDYPDGATLKIDPMRNFPLVTDLVVDAALLYERTREVGTPIVREAEPLRENSLRELPDGVADFTRFENCIECGLCLSACPSMAADPFYLGPVALAFAERALNTANENERERIINLIDDEHGLWRCHSAFECTEVCPSNVDPAGAIMRLKRIVAVEKFRGLWPKK